MRHRKHNHQLGVKSAHRVSLVANLSCSLIEHGRIKTTLAKARALRPAVEKLITLAKKAHGSEDSARKMHFRRLAIARLRNKKAVAKLFDELVNQFVSRKGGYTRIYKLALPRLGDAADMALIEFVEEAPKKKSKKKKAPSKTNEPQESIIEKDSSEKGAKTVDDTTENTPVETSETVSNIEEAPKTKKKAKSPTKKADTKSKKASTSVKDSSGEESKDDTADDSSAEK
jgi:large subunit ribosomal protein L17